MSKFSVGDTVKSVYGFHSHYGEGKITEVDGLYVKVDFGGRNPFPNDRWHEDNLVLVRRAVKHPDIGKYVKVYNGAHYGLVGEVIDTYVPSNTTIHGVVGYKVKFDNGDIRQYPAVSVVITAKPEPVKVEEKVAPVEYIVVRQGNKILKKFDNSKYVMSVRDRSLSIYKRDGRFNVELVGSWTEYGYTSATLESE